MNHTNTITINNIKTEIIDAPKLQSPNEERQRTLSNALNLLHLDADKVLSAFGKYGRYQMIAYLLLNGAFMIFALEMMVMTFISKIPPFQCEINENYMEIYEMIDQCTIRHIATNNTVSCNSDGYSRYKFNFNNPEQSTLASEFNLVCEDDKWLPLLPMSSSIFMLGGMVSTPIVTQLSDLKGRRSTYLLPLYLTIIANFVCPFSPNYMVFLVFRFLAGFGSMAFISVGWVLTTESVAVAFRPILPLVGILTWFIGYESVGIASIFFHNWRWHYFVIALPGLLVIPFYWWIPESLHWMITHKKASGVKRYIRHSSKVNNKELELEQCSADEVPSEAASRRTFLDILKSGHLVFHLILWTYLMTMMNMVYWGLSLFSAELSDDGITGFLLSGLVEVPGGLLGVALLHVMGRRSICALGLGGQTMAFIGAVFITDSGWLTMSFPLFAKLTNCIVWTAMPLLLTEMIPTSVRNVFGGGVGFTSELGSVFAPYLNNLTKYHKSAPALLLGGLTVIGAFAMALMPETKDRPLPEDIDQFDAGCLFPASRRLPIATDKAEQTKKKATTGNANEYHSTV